MANPKKLTVLSLCAGYGGLELGLARALANPLRCVAVEIEAYALANLVAKAQEGKLAIEALYPDLRTFPAERFSGCFDFILAGYPCQPFSVAGKRQGTEDPRHLWPHIARIVQAVKPVWCFFENVPGHLTLGFPEVYRSLRDMGYSVEAGLFTAAEVGAPHKRQRLFILAESGECDGLRGAARLRRRIGEPSQAGESRGIGELADAAELRVEGGQHDNAEAHRQGSSEEKPCRSCSSGTRWPARPGQPQYEWEEPRVVVEHSMRSRSPSDRGNVGVGRVRKQPKEDEGQGQGQAQPGVGGAVNGPSSRVDRLRLLGNGVIPHQAERALRRLIDVQTW